jgi:twitching motility protein PilT
LVGEMRDLETTEIAMVAAETGHLVLSTLHTVDAVETINRIVSIFPAHQQAQTRLQLGAILRGVVSQRLVPRADGKGMVPAVEIMVTTARVRELIEDPARTREIRDAIMQGREPYGMIGFDQSLAELVQQKLVTYEEAVKNSTTPDDFALLFRGVASGGSADAWQQEQMHKQNVRTTPGRPSAGPVAAQPAGGASPPGFEIERFGKE